MPQGTRPDRVADQLRAELSDIIAREVHDPGIGFVTLTRVTVSPPQWDSPASTLSCCTRA